VVYAHRPPIYCLGWGPFFFLQFRLLYGFNLFEILAILPEEQSCIMRIRVLDRRIASPIAIEEYLK